MSEFTEDEVKKLAFTFKTLFGTLEKPDYGKFDFDYEFAYEENQSYNEHRRNRDTIKLSEHNSRRFDNTDMFERQVLFDEFLKEKYNDELLSINQKISKTKDKKELYLLKKEKKELKEKIKNLFQ